MCVLCVKTRGASEITPMVTTLVLLTSWSASWRVMSGKLLPICPRRRPCAFHADKGVKGVPSNTCLEPEQEAERRCPCLFG